MRQALRKNFTIWFESIHYCRKFYARVFDLIKGFQRNGRNEGGGGWDFYCISEISRDIQRARIRYVSLLMDDAYSRRLLLHGQIFILDLPSWRLPQTHRIREADLRTTTIYANFIALREW